MGKKYLRFFLCHPPVMVELVVYTNTLVGNYKMEFAVVNQNNPNQLNQNRESCNISYKFKQDQRHCLKSGSVSTALMKKACTWFSYHNTNKKPKYISYRINKSKKAQRTLVIFCGSTGFAILHCLLSSLTYFNNFDSF